MNATSSTYFLIHNFQSQIIDLLLLDWMQCCCELLMIFSSLPLGKGIKVIDVGSCYAPLNSHPEFDCLAIDLHPASEVCTNNSVMFYCTVSLGCGIKRLWNKQSCSLKTSFWTSIEMNNLLVVQKQVANYNSMDLLLSTLDHWRLDKHLTLSIQISILYFMWSPE